MSKIGFKCYFPGCQQVMIDDPFSMGDDDVSGGNESGGGDDESSSGSDFGGNYLDNNMLTTYWCIPN